MNEQKGGLSPEGRAQMKERGRGKEKYYSHMNSKVNGFDTYIIIRMHHVTYVYTS